MCSIPVPGLGNLPPKSGPFSSALSAIMARPIVAQIEQWTKANYAPLFKDHPEWKCEEYQEEQHEEQQDDQKDIDWDDMTTLARMRPADVQRLSPQQKRRHTVLQKQHSAAEAAKK
eukprot:m51a1_g13014 hypothetical protein (116) ;mRNA; f:233-2211